MTTKESNRPPDPIKLGGDKIFMRVKSTGALPALAASGVELRAIDVRPAEPTTARHPRALIRLLLRRELISSL
jgi:hypothetical protein